MRFIRSIGLVLTFFLCVPFGWGQEGDGTAGSGAVEVTEDSAGSDNFEVIDAHAGEVIVVCPITGAIEMGVQVLVERAIEEARELNAKLIIFRVDTPGGRMDSAVVIAKAIGEAPCRTLAYIEGMGAISAGALISFACDDLIMTADTNIGAATPVFMTSEGMETASDKSISYIRAKMRALAEAKGHNADIAQSMVDKDIELRGYENERGKYVVYATNAGSGVSEIIENTHYRAGSELVLAKGKLLTLTPKEAVKYGVIETTVASLDEAVTHFMLGGGTYHIVEPNRAEKTFRFLTSLTIAGLLLMLGMGGLYFVVKRVC